MIDSDRITIQLSVYLIGDEWETTIQGLNGSFDIDDMRVLLGSEQPYYGDIYREIEKLHGKEEESCYSVYAEVKWCERETQEGTGYGDILTLPGYYYIGNSLEIIQHTHTDEPMINWCEHGKMLVCEECAERHRSTA
jgi:hypothetical protein